MYGAKVCEISIILYGSLSNAIANANVARWKYCNSRDWISKQYNYYFKILVEIQHFWLAIIGE